MADDPVGCGSGLGLTSEGPRAEPQLLESHVRALEGVRHPETTPDAHRAAAEYARRQLEHLDLQAEMVPFDFRGRTHHNVVARLEGTDPSRPRVLIGAHYDTVRGSPGADDNASGVAGVLECARLLAGRAFPATIEFVAFDLEESQRTTYRVGSRRHARAARKARVRYAGALVFEMIGYRDRAPASQRVPKLISWMGIPSVGDFVAVTGDGQSRKLLRTFEAEAASAAPELPVVPLVTPLRGWVVWQTRLSDNASFWSSGYPALMITDTAFLRNPHYHRASDRAETLDYRFMASIVDATVATTVRLAGA